MGFELLSFSIKNTIKQQNALFLVISKTSLLRFRPHYFGVGVAVVLPSERFVLWTERTVVKRGTAGTRINFCKGKNADLNNDVNI